MTEEDASMTTRLQGDDRVGLQDVKIDCLTDGSNSCLCNHSHRMRCIRCGFTQDVSKREPSLKNLYNSALRALKNAASDHSFDHCKYWNEALDYENSEADEADTLRDVVEDHRMLFRWIEEEINSIVIDVRPVASVEILKRVRKMLGTEESDVQEPVA